MGTTRVIVAEGTEGSLNLGPKRPRVYSDLSQDEKDRYNADIRATNIILQGLPKDIYSLINHYTDAKDIWDNVKMLLEGSELTKEDHESQLTSSNPSDQVQLRRRVVVQNVQGRQNRGQGNNARGAGAGAVGYGGAQNRVGNANPAQENGVVLDEEQLLFLAYGQDNAIDEDVDKQPVQDLALNVDNVFQADDCDAYDSDVDEAPTAQTMFMANLSSADPVYDEAGPSYDSNVLSEVHDHDHYQDAVCDHHEEHDDCSNVQVVDSHADYTSDSNMTPYDQYVKDNVVPVVQNNASMVPNDAYVMIDNDVHESDVLSVSHTPRNTVVNNLLNAELANSRNKLTRPSHHRNKLTSDNKYFGPQDMLRMKVEALKEQDTCSLLIKRWTVYPPNTTERLSRALTKEVKEMSDAFDELEAELDQSIVDRKHDEIEWKNLLIEHDNIIADGLSKEVFYVASNFKLNVSRFTEMQKAQNVVKARVGT
ncbi:hypothetical protein Tco_1408982 [Tanacetum coccineum]